MSDVADAKHVLPLPALMHRLGLGEHAKKKARCPFHDDHRKSFSVWQNENGWFWKCHAGCGKGDEINLLELHKHLSRSDATKVYLEMAGVNGARPNKATLSVAFDWRSCVDAFTETHVERLAKWRGYAVEFCNWLKQGGFVGLYNDCIAFPVHDDARKVVAVHYRLKDGSWRYYPQGTKVRALVIGELLAGESVHIFESQWDGFAFMDKSGEYDGIIITRGAGNGALVSSLIPESSTVFAWTQNDEAGEKWQKDICANTKAIVRRVKIPALHKDLNDWTREGATADDLLKAMQNAEVIHQREESWSDALNESVVASNKLRQLELKPRKRLLGDWLCEGDLGLLFAFRGVGKTWYALAIAQTLSGGGKLGNWQAHGCVKVLYIDGEMPPDLICDRSEGLGGSKTSNLEFLNHEILFERTGKVLNITQPEIQQSITEYCLNAGVKVLILDNLSTLASGMRENEADSWELVNNWLLDLRRRKIAVIIVHHAGRSGEMRGTSKREDNVFWIIALDDAKKSADDKRGARFISRFTKPSRNTQEEVPAYEWHLVTDNLSGEVSISHKLAQSLDVFRQCIEEGVTDCSQLAVELKLSPGQISKMAKKAQDAGWLRKKGREYELVNGNESL